MPRSDARQPTRASLEDIEAQAGERVLDGLDDALSTDDIEPAAQTEDTARLRQLIAAAENLAGAANDPKLAKLQDHLGALAQGGLPARRLLPLHRHGPLPGRVPACASSRTSPIKAVTGELTPGEREAAIEELGEPRTASWSPPTACPRASTCSSLFTAVVHYDLTWNPTRHEQREGRVDRFGQKAREVRSTMLYGEDNPVDGAVLQVILRKAESIRKELGVLVPMPDDEGKLTQALLNAVLLRKHGHVGNNAQIELDFGEPAKEHRSRLAERPREGRARTAPSSPSAA